MKRHVDTSLLKIQLGEIKLGTVLKQLQTLPASVALSRISCCEKRHLEIVIGKYVWELWSCKKYISHVCKRDEPSGQLRIYYSGTMPKQKDNLRGD